MHFSKLLQGSKSAITMRPVLIESITKSKIGLTRNILKMVDQKLFIIIEL